MTGLQTEFRCPKLGINQFINLPHSCKVCSSEENMEKGRFDPLLKSFRRL